MGGINPSTAVAKSRRISPYPAFAGRVFLLAGIAGLWMSLSCAPATYGASPSLHGHVVLPDGTPAVGATVFVALPGPSNLRIRNGKIAFEDLGGQKLTYVTTGADGSYDLPAQTGLYVVAAIADAGYAQLDQDDLAKSTDLTLRAWGKVRGRLMIGTKPGAAVKLQGGTNVKGRKNPPVQISMCNRAETDANGDFTMDCVLPGHFEIDKSSSSNPGRIQWGSSRKSDPPM